MLPTSLSSSSSAAADPLGRRTYAGLAADAEGVDDRRPPLVLLHGLTFDRAMWRPALAHLRLIDAGRRVFALDLPGHGESAAQPSHRLADVVEAVHRATAEARLEAPVMVGHSVSGLVATVYAARHPTRGVVNVDQPLQVEGFVQAVQAMADQLRGPGFAAAWARIAAGLHAELLPASAQALLRATERPRQDLVLSYWQELFERTLPELRDWLAGEIDRCRASGVPYLLVAGKELDARERRSLRKVLPRASVEAWPGSGHFPHLAHPERFAASLAATAGWSGSGAG